MSAPGRPKREYRSAQREGNPANPPGRPKGEYRSAQREGTPANASGRRVGVIGTGAMGGGVVQSLVRAGVATSARDIRDEAQALAVRHGAAPTFSPADLARACEVIVLLVVDAAQIETVLFGADGVTTAGSSKRIVLVSSTVDPAYVAALAPRLVAHGIALLDAPVSGGPAKATAGTMTMMVSGDAEAFAQVRAMLEQITGRLFALGPRPGDASTFKIVNNLLAAANLAAGAEALALARAAGLDLRPVFDVVAASSGASWMFGDRVPRALAGDYAPRAAAKLLDKDSGIAAALADRLHVDAPFTRLAHRAFAAAVAEGCGDEDDAVLIRRALESVQPPER
jgi:3-hydroxyisobutyrate dehydrogenase-like beta-hydroxyacid dehydrogenase